MNTTQLPFLVEGILILAGMIYRKFTNDIRIHDTLQFINAQDCRFSLHSQLSRPC
jgi:hypothetical protein